MFFRRRGRFTDAPRAYSREEQQRFRRELEQLAKDLTAALESLSRGTDAEASVHSMVKSYMFSETGESSSSTVT